jgi:hypothetical protein
MTIEDSIMTDWGPGCKDFTRIGFAWAREVLAAFNVRRDCAVVPHRFGVAGG